MANKIDYKTDEVVRVQRVNGGSIELCGKFAGDIVQEVAEMCLINLREHGHHRLSVTGGKIEIVTQRELELKHVNAKAKAKKKSYMIEMITCKVTELTGDTKKKQKKELDKDSKTFMALRPARAQAPNRCLWTFLLGKDNRNIDRWLWLHQNGATDVALRSHIKDFFKSEGGSDVNELVKDAEAYECIFTSDPPQAFWFGVDHEGSAELIVESKALLNLVRDTCKIKRTTRNRSRLFLGDDKEGLIGKKGTIDNN